MDAARAEGTALPPPTNPGFRVLFIRYERIGDMIMATSLIRNIAKALPGGKVDVLATPATAPVLEGNPHVGNVLVLDRKSVHSYRELMKRLRRERYTVMVDGRINNPPIFTSTPLLMYAGQARFRVGAGGRQQAAHLQRLGAGVEPRRSLHRRARSSSLFRSE